MASVEGVDATPSQSSGFQMSTCVAYIKDVNNGGSDLLKDEHVQVIKDSLEIKRLESEIEKLLYAREEVKNAQKCIQLLCDVLVLLSKDIVEEEMNKKKNESEPVKVKADTHNENKNKNENKSEEVNPTVIKSEEVNPTKETQQKDDQPENELAKESPEPKADKVNGNLRIDGKPKVTKTVTFYLCDENEKEEEEGNQLQIDIHSTIASMDSDIIMEMERIDDEYIKFPSSQPDSIKDKRPKYTVLTENISDEDCRAITQSMVVCLTRGSLF